MHPSARACSVSGIDIVSDKDMRQETEIIQDARRRARYAAYQVIENILILAGLVEKQAQDVSIYIGENPAITVHV